MYKNNFVVISEGKIAFPTDSIKNNGLGSIIPIKSYLRFILNNPTIEFHYPINTYKPIDILDLNDSEIPGGPVTLVVTGRSCVYESSLKAINNQHRAYFEIEKELIYTRSTRPSMEQALKAASIITSDPVKISSLAAKVCNYNLSAISILDLKDLSNFIHYWSITLDSILKLKGEEHKDTFSNLMKVVNKYLSNLESLAYPNIKLDQDNIYIKKGCTHEEQTNELETLLK